VPAFSNESYPLSMHRKGSVEYEHHIATWGKQDKFGYKDFIPMFKAENFDHVAWTKPFKESGAKFIVPVAEHHDGFQMYKSALSTWNSFETGPKRDVLGELGKAAREAGLVFGASSHRAEHYWFMGYGRDIPSDVRAPVYADFYGPAHKPPFGPKGEIDNYLSGGPDREYLEDRLARTCELIDAYRPRLIWFDWWIMNIAFKPYLKKLAAYYYNRGAEWGLEVAINNKYDAFPTGTTVFDVERGRQGGIRSLFWQNDTSVSKNSWGYIRNQDYKEPDGSIPKEEARILREIGAWLAVNGEAVYGTGYRKAFGEGPTKVTEGAFTDTNGTHSRMRIFALRSRAMPYTRPCSSGRFTTRCSSSHSLRPSGFARCR